MIVTAPSYIIPGTYLENLQFLARTQEEGGLHGIAGMELLFFIFDPETDELYAKERKSVERFADRYSFTVHMPDDLKEEHEGIVEMTKGLAKHYVLHPPITESAGPGRAKEFANLVKKWTKRYGEIFIIENLNEARDFTAYLADDNLGICLDVGHLLLNDGSPADFLVYYGSKVKQIHLHGVKDGKDHTAIDSGAAWFRELTPALKNFKGVVELEVFDADTLRHNLEVLNNAGVV